MFQNKNRKIIRLYQQHQKTTDATNQGWKMAPKKPRFLGFKKKP